MTKDKTKITIAVPTNRGFQPETFQCLLELIAEVSSKYNLHLICPEHGYTIAENRNYIVVQALNNKSEWLLMIDDDMTFPPDTLDKLISNDKDICGVAYHPRCDLDRMKAIDETHYVNLEKNKDPKYKDVFECHATGTGIILIKTSIFLKIKRPWFQFEYHPTGQCKLGEDWYFCENAKKFNIKTFADPTIKVGHIGEKIN